MTALDITRLRPVLESEIERLIGILDLLEPDPDFEDGADLEEDRADDEPWLGATSEMWQLYWATTIGLHDDREQECEDEGAQCDDEGAIDCDMEIDYDNEGESLMMPFGPCSPISTMLGAL